MAVELGPLSFREEGLGVSVWYQGPSGGQQISAETLDIQEHGVMTETTQVDSDTGNVVHYQTFVPYGALLSISQAWVEQAPAAVSSTEGVAEGSEPKRQPARRRK